MSSDAVEPWELFPAYRTRPGYSLAWRGRLRELARAVAAVPGVAVRHPDRAPGRPLHAVRAKHGRESWRARELGALLAWPPTLSATPGGAWQWMGISHTARTLPPGAALFVDILDRDSDDALEIGVVTPRGLLSLPRHPDLEAPGGGTLWNWRAFAADPAILDGVLAVYCTTGNAELALSVIEAARERGELE